MYSYLPAATVLLCSPLFQDPSLYTPRRLSLDAQLPYEGRARKQRTLLKKMRAVFGNKGGDNNNSCSHWLVNSNCQIG